MTARAAFTSLLGAFRDPDPRVRRDAVARSASLRDSRLLFTLVNLQAHDPELAPEIRRAVEALRDPRAGEWLGNDAAAGRTDFHYTYMGPDADLAKAGQGGRRVVIEGRASLREPELASFLRDERHGDLSYALFVVLPDAAADPFNGECRMVVAPWRSEHYLAAKGGDVLAAGVVGFSGDSIEEITNQSGGYYPAPSSFVWVQKALARAGVPLAASAYTQTWPPEGYFAEGVLSRFPLYRERP